MVSANHAWQIDQCSQSAGINTSTIPTYQAECSNTTNRGLLICIEGGIIAFGTLIAYWIDFGASYGPPDLYVYSFPPLSHLLTPCQNMALPHRLPNRLRPYNHRLHDLAPRISPLAPHPRPPRRSQLRHCRPSRSPRGRRPSQNPDERHHRKHPRIGTRRRQHTVQRAPPRRQAAALPPHDAGCVVAILPTDRFVPPPPSLPQTTLADNV